MKYLHQEGHMGEKTETKIRDAIKETDTPESGEVFSGHLVRCRPMDEDARRLCVLIGTLVEDHLIGQKLPDRVVAGPGLYTPDGYDLISFGLMTAEGKVRISRAGSDTEDTGAAAEDKGIIGSRSGAAGVRKVSGSEEGQFGTGQIAAGHTGLGSVPQMLGLSMTDDPPEPGEGDCGAYSPPVLFVKILTEPDCSWMYLDTAQVLEDAGAHEYWLIDIRRQFVYVFYLGADGRYCRYSFAQTIESRCYPGLRLCIARIMWGAGGSLRELSVFTRFVIEEEAVRQQMIVAEPGAGLGVPFRKGGFSASQFYRWLKVRRHLPLYSGMTELLLGKVEPGQSPSLRHQFLQGNLFYELKSRLRQAGERLRICFSPMAVELTGKGMLDSVLRPDIFLIDKPDHLYDNIYKGVPVWVIEIADPLTAARDYLDKEQIFHFHGVREYWIINDWKQQVMVICYGSAREASPVEPETHIYTYEEEIPMNCLPGQTICMKEVLDL